MLWSFLCFLFMMTHLLESLWAETFFFSPELAPICYIFHCLPPPPFFFLLPSLTCPPNVYCMYCMCCMYGHLGLFFGCGQLQLPNKAYPYPYLYLYPFFHLKNISKVRKILILNWIRNVSVLSY